MIIDKLPNASLYLRINERLPTAFRYLQDTDLSIIQPGKYEIEGSNIYALVQEYETKTKEKGRWEAHRRYIDVQYIFQGTELFGYAELGQMKVGAYDEGKDFLSLEGEGDFFTIHPGSFVILAPQDAHMPGIAISTPQAVKKVVVKVRLADK